MTWPREKTGFGRHAPFSIGIEEELFLVDPNSGRLANVAASLIPAVGDVAPAKVKSELHACHVELITGVCRSVADAVASLDDLRGRVASHGPGVIGTGTHPGAAEGEAEITRSERYERIATLLGDAVATPVAALHIHIGMPDPETAIRSFNGLRRHLPLLEALGANSPFRHGRDTGFASARAMTIRGWPRSGTPRQMADFRDFEAYAERLTRVARVPDYTYHWWKLRPHPRLGTVEVRALDSQASPRQTAALAALVQSLARYEATVDPERAGPPPEVLEEISYQASRGGINASLPGFDGPAREVAALADAAVRVARPSAVALGCADELDLVAEVLEVGGGAGVQRKAHEDGGIDGALSVLMSLASG